MPLTIADLFASPDHYLHSFDGPDAVFVPMDKAAYRRSIFLDDRIQPAASGAMRVPVGSLLECRDQPEFPCSWVFHVAHCGSTLLARALGELGDALVLREPLALRQLAIAPDQARLALTLAMLGKRHAGAGATIVKANVPVNFLIPAIAAAQLGAKAVFLYYTLADYVLAIARSENHRAWLRRVTGELAAKLGDLAALSDAECAAALWLAQLRLFRDGLEQMPNARTLDAEAFFARPQQVLRAAARLFDVECSSDQIAQLVQGPMFASYAKNPAVPFDNAARIERRDELQHLLAAEIEEACAWIERTAPDGDLLTAALSERRLD